MKLNTKWPKEWRSRPARLLVQAVALVHLVRISAASHPTRGSPLESNEISHKPRKEFDHFSRDVTDLRSLSDFRSIRLRWKFEHTDANRPESFRIRYCELTSWRAEIKCRHKDMEVQLAANDREADSEQQTRAVIRQGRDEPHMFETQIFDLRAMTNYTFQVNVLRFIGETRGANSKVELSPANSSARQRPIARRLELATLASNELVPPPGTKVAATKPFSAEALKCLANSSEVQVNTGRYFGGRISVEGQSDARCQLLGNKSSDQSVYSFHIDHEICRSRVMDGNRVETMILVHENKDLVTHSTARFLVMCNIGQKSFTVKASILLPRVMNSLGGERPAAISPAAGKPGESATESRGIRLGSMPGIYRLIRADSSTAATEVLHKPQKQSIGGGEPLEVSASRQSTATATTAASAPAALELMASTSQAARQSRELTADELSSAAHLPRPVNVSSGVLYVERAREGASPRAARNMQTKPRLLADVVPIRPPVNPWTAPVADSSELGSPDSSAGEPVVMTNNHRIPGEDMQMKSAPVGGRGNFSIKYSTATDVGEFALGSVSEAHSGGSSTRAATTTAPTSPSPVARSRSGRMRQITSAPTSTMASHLAAPNFASRMGDAATATAATSGGEGLPATTRDLLVGASSNRHESVAEPSALPELQQASANLPQSLAQNITGALIKLTLRTLGNLARKSLESLAVEEPRRDLGRESTADSEGHLDGFLVDDSTQQTPRVQTTRTHTRGGLNDLSRLPPGQEPVRQSREQSEPTPEATPMKPTPAAPTSARPKSQGAHRTSEPPGAQQFEARDSKRDYAHEPARSPWLPYALWAAICLIALIIVALYFILAPLGPGAEPYRTAAQTRTRIGAGRQLSRGLFARFNEAVSPDSPAKASGTRATIRSARQEIEQAGVRPACGLREATPSSPVGSATTRSTSAASSTSSGPGEENYCKTNEQLVVYADYLLLTDDNTSLTLDSSQRRRTGRESFA